MAKFALVGYGSDGRGVGTTEQGYTYVVNDNVRTGDNIQPIATSRAGRKFVTTGLVNHAYKETGTKGQQAKQEAQQNGVSEPTRVYSGKELGVSGSRQRPPKQEGMEKRPQSQYTNLARGGNVAKLLESNPNAELTPKAQQTFDEYSKQFMRKGEE